MSVKALMGRSDEVLTKRLELGDNRLNNMPLLNELLENSTSHVTLSGRRVVTIPAEAIASFHARKEEFDTSTPEGRAFPNEGEAPAGPQTVYLADLARLMTRFSLMATQENMKASGYAPSNPERLAGIGIGNKLKAHYENTDSILSSSLVRRITHFIQMLFRREYFSGPSTPRHRVMSDQIKESLEQGTALGEAASPAAEPVPTTLSWANVRNAVGL